MRSLHVSDGIMDWDGYDDMPVAALPVEFRMPDIERYTGIECPVFTCSYTALPSMALRRVYLEVYGQILPFRLKGEEVRIRPQALRCWYYWNDRTPISRRPPFQSQFLGTPYQMIQHGQYRPVAPIRPVGPTYLHPPPQPVYATQAPQGRLCSSIINHHTAYPTRIQDRSSLYLHQRAGHDTDNCSALRHAIQDLIDQGLVDLGRPGVAINPLPTHDTRAVPPPPEGYKEWGVARPPLVDRPFAGIAAKRRFKEKMMRYYTSYALLRLAYHLEPFGLMPSGASVLLDNGSALNVCPLVTAIALGFSPDDFGLLHRLLELMMGLRGQIWSSFNLLLGRPWIHEAGAIPSSLHQKVKFIHEGRIITIQSDRDIITSFELVLNISHNEDDLHLTGFTFDEVQVVSLEDGSRDMVPMSFDQHNNTLVLSMMRGMSYLPGMGLGRRQQGPTSLLSQLITTRPTDLVTSPQRLMHGFRAYTSHRGDCSIPETVEIQDIQQALGQIHLDTGTTEAPGAMIVAPHHRTELIDEDDSIPDAYTDDMDFIGIGLLDVVTSDFTSVEGAFDSVDPPLSFDTMSGTHTHIYDVDDVGDTDDPLGDQPRDIRIGSSLSPDERSRLIDLLRASDVILHGWFSGYNQILMAPEDMVKTSFITEWGTYCYRVMPFGLKNAGATYQRAARDRADHLAALQRFFERIRQFRLRLNPKKCTFGVTSRKLLGHIVSEQSLIFIMVTQKSVKGSIVADHLASLPISDDRSVDDDFPDEQIDSCPIGVSADLCPAGAP
ncbi:hypothetical protein CK203_089738 [Vitis vinifera]|uniref:Uncharacterized protein n=1 Tax=Vitis vinifera TaxID=29760 RepID=A0A438BLC9_VITVI|nr:hypothetical protein CK203_089738 [Vitis vinifera]